MKGAHPVKEPVDCVHSYLSTHIHTHTHTPGDVEERNQTNERTLKEDQKELVSKGHKKVVFHIELRTRGTD